MKKNILKFIKVFSLTLIATCLLVGIVIFSYLKIFNPLDKLAFDSTILDLSDDDSKDGNSKDETPLDKAIKASKRINILVMGLEHTRTDTIMLASFDRETKEGNLISIPRDTYIDREGYIDGSAKRINAIYGTDGLDALIDTVEKMFQMPVHKYVLVDYQAVVAGVDALGGIEVNIPFRMYYTDLYDNPPLVIDFTPGKKLLNGEDSLRFLRFRQNNDGTGYPRMDLDRIAAQQSFVKEAIKKC